MELTEQELQVLKDCEVQNFGIAELKQRAGIIKNEVRVLQQQVAHYNHQIAANAESLKDNEEKIKMNKQLPYLVANVVELMDAEDNQDIVQPVSLASRYELDMPKKKTVEEKKPSKSIVVKTTTRQNIFLPVIGLVPAEELRPGDRIGVNKDSYLVLTKLPPEYDARAKAMELDERPTENYSDIGGLDKQVQELVEAIVLPMTHADRFESIGIRPPKGCLLYGPPGTGKTLLARAVAAQTNACFLKLAGPQLVQMFIGDGAKIIRDAFELAKTKAPAIIFIDELDAIGTKRGDGDGGGGDREVQRTLLELLNQLDGFASSDGVKVIAATNRPDTLDPALMRSGRLDRKIELPHPNLESRQRILEIHSRKMSVSKDIQFKELARATDEFNGAQLKAVCVEAGMFALRRQASEICHEDFIEGVAAVKAKKKSSLNYFA